MSVRAQPQSVAARAGDLDVLIVGAGFGGVYLLHALREQGFKALIVEAGDGLGGVWHWNCYPGARVDTDVPAYEFSAEEIWKDWNWTERFPGGPELRRYFEHVDKVWNLSPDVRLGTRVTAAIFDEGQFAWKVETQKGERFNARFVVLCTGFATKPYIPRIVGLERFEGTCVHSARWPQEGLDLTGKKVAIVGTGASGVQLTQEASAVASQVTVFQRTPILALPMQQKRLTREGQAAEKTEYEKRFEIRNATFAGLEIDFRPEAAFEVTDTERRAIYEDLWQKGGFNFWLGTFRDILIDEKANRTAYDFWRDKTRARIRDPEVAALLAPDEPPHPFGVKRPSLEQNYFEAFNLDHVQLVDLRKTPIESVAADGVIAGGKHYPADVLVLATGFDAVTGGLLAMDIRGRDGANLKSKWSDGVTTYLGAAIAGFPNLMMVYGPQSPSGFANGPTNAELQGDWIVRMLAKMREQRLTFFEATEDAEREWDQLVKSLTHMTLFPKADSWYMGANIPGKKRQLLGYPGGLPDYLKRCEDVLDDGFRGFKVA